MDRTENEKTQPSPKKRSILKWIIGIVLVLLLLVIIVVAVAPFYISSNSGRNMIVGKINSSIDGHVSIADLSMGWFSGIRLRDVNFKDNKGSMSVAVKSIYAEPHYGALVRGDLSFGKTLIDEPVITVDLAKFEQETPAQPQPQEQKPEPKQQGKKGELPLKRIDLVINNGNFKVMDSSNKIPQVEIAKINTSLNLRPAGQQTLFNINLIAADTPVSIAGDITPSRSHGWQLVGTSGNVKININNLNLASLRSITAMVDPNIVANGVLSINGVARLNEGVFEQLTAKLEGSNLKIRLPQMKGDTFATKKLHGNVDIASAQELMNIKNFNIETDWANIVFTGTVPKSFKSVSDLLAPQSAAQLQGDVNVDLPAILSQLPNTIGLKPGTKINSGKLTAKINTESAGNAKVLVAKASIANLSGVVNNKPANLTQPILLDARIAGFQDSFRIENLALDSSFAKLNVSGTMDAIKYNINSDLGTMQSDLGQFVDFGTNRFGGQLTANGNVSMKQNTVASKGTAKIEQLAITTKDGAKVSEPAADLNYDIMLDQKANTLKVETFNATTSFAKINLANSTIATAPGAPMDLTATASADLEKAMPWAVVFGGVPKTMQMAGQVNAKLVVTSKNTEYHIVAQDTRIDNLKIVAQNQPPFQQQRIDLIADMYVDPVEKTYRIVDFKLTSPAVNIQLEKFKQTKTSLNGTIKADYDLAGVTAMAAPFLPAGLTMTGKRNDTITFSSQWPQDKPDMMMANMNADASFGFQSAEYMGLVLGTTDIKLNIKNGLMNITPFKTTCNSGTLQFGGTADFKKKPTMLVMPADMDVVNNVQINDKVAAALLKNVNPLFASAKNTRGSANLRCKTFAIPIAGGSEMDNRIDATVSVVDLNLQSPLLSGLGQVLKLLKVTSNPSAAMGLHPTNFVMQNGILKYNQMQVDVSGMSLTFSGQMGPGEKMNMSVILPGGLAVALQGTKSKPSLDIAKTTQLILQQQLTGGLLGGKDQQGQQQNPLLNLPGLGGQQQQTQPGQTTPQTPQTKRERRQQQQQQIQQGVQDLLKGLGGSK